MNAKQQVLAGTKVVDWTTMAAGPGATAVLADFGADVIKIESVKGDPWRKVGERNTLSHHFTHHTTAAATSCAAVQGRRATNPVRCAPPRCAGLAPQLAAIQGSAMSTGSEAAPQHSRIFESDNREKRSIALDLSTAAGVRAFKALCKTADVLVTNVRVAGTQRLGLDYETMHAEFPRLTYAHITAWGRSGPMRDAPGYDAGAFWYVQHTCRGVGLLAAGCWLFVAHSSFVYSSVLQPPIPSQSLPSCDRVHRASFWIKFVARCTLHVALREQ